ncbi:MAG: HNH endonuclease [Gallionella sp.]|nr:HNH endonuclease [Gallionella sp.]
MKNQYRNNRWVAYREELIELDGGACVRCGRTREVGAILQVHHKKYIAGKAPWEYPYDLCETLCKRCHAVEHGEIRPEIGWEYVGEDDLGGLYGTCDRCGTSLRYVFFVQHPNWEPMSVGTVCCDDLTGTQIASEKRKYDDRLMRFIKSKRWSESDKRHLIKQKQIEIQIVSANSGYSIHMNGIKGTKMYPTLDAAKERVFNFIESGEAEDYFKDKD